MLKIIIVDNNVLFREGLVHLLQHEAEIQMMGEAGCISDAEELIRRTKPNLVLLDAELADMVHYQGLRALSRQRLLDDQGAAMQIVLLSGQVSEDALLKAIRYGARGFLPKDHSLDKFMAAIRAIERGEAVIPRALVGRLLDEFSHQASLPEQDGLDLLTMREVEVLYELGQGRSNRQIAERLFISENTVKVHVHNILEKLNFRNRRQAARYALFQDIETPLMQKNAFARVD